MHTTLSAPKPTRRFEQVDRIPEFGPEFNYRGYFDDEETRPIEPMFFRGKPIMLTSRPFNVLPDTEDYTCCNTPASLVRHILESGIPIYDSIGRPRSKMAEIEANTLWDILHRLNCLKTDTSELVFLVDVLWIAVRSMMNELAEAPDAREYLRERMLDAVAEPVRTNLKKKPR